MDADLQHPPELLGELIAALHEGSDVAIASRYAPGLSPWRGTFRRGLSAGFTWVTRPLQRGGKRVGDPLSGFFLLRRHCVENIPFRRTGFKLLLEILVRGRVGSVREVPYTFGRRAAGRSKASLPVAWDYLQLVVQLYREQVRAGRIAGAAAD
jgi:dolichol-phosphate mannosyltransferase